MENKQQDVMEELTLEEFEAISGGLYQGDSKGGDNPLHGGH